MGQNSDNSQQPLAEPQTVVDQTTTAVYDDEPLTGEEALYDALNSHLKIEECGFTAGQRPR
jgi:hypothetical protein